MIYAFIEQRRTQYPVRRLCELFDISSAGFYDWRLRSKSAREKSDEQLLDRIREVHDASHKTYGRPRIHAVLRTHGSSVGHNHVGRLMREAEIKGVSPRRFRKTTDSRHRLAIAPNIVKRQFNPESIGELNRVWAGDTTFVATRSGFLYLAVVIDLYSRMIVGWSMSAFNDTQLVTDALESAISSRKPAAGVMFHSDRGSTYASSTFRAVLKSNGVRQSMSRKADCWDNAPVESFFGTMKTELQQTVFGSHDDARLAILNYIESSYNRRRLHSTLCYRSPLAFEESSSAVAA